MRELRWYHGFIRPLCKYFDIEDFLFSIKEGY